MPVASDAPSARRQIFIQPVAQGRVLYATLTHCLLSSAVTLLAVAGWLQWQGSNTAQFSFSFWGIPLLATILLAVPLALRDAAKISNQLLGPMSRVVGSIRRVGRHGEHVQPLDVREHELWAEWFQEFNDMLSRVQRRRSIVSKVSSPREKLSS